jgi:hypothetical protein
MPSLLPSQLLPTIEFLISTKKETIAIYYPLFNLTQRTYEQAKFELAIIVKIYKSVKIWPPYPSLLCLETKAKIKVSYIKYNNPKDDERE